MHATATRRTRWKLPISHSAYFMRNYVVQIQITFAHSSSSSTSTQSSLHFATMPVKTARLYIVRSARVKRAWCAMSLRLCCGERCGAVRLSNAIVFMWMLLRLQGLIKYTLKPSCAATSRDHDRANLGDNCILLIELLSIDNVICCANSEEKS